MELREKLLRNEVRLLSEDLCAVSEELLILQDFIKKEYGTKYIKFCQSRTASASNNTTEDRGRRYGRRTHLFPVVDSSRSRAIAAESPDEDSDASDQAIYNALDDNDPDIEEPESYAPAASEVEDNDDGGGDDSNQPPLKRTKKEQDDPDFDPSQYVSVKTTRATNSSSNKPKRKHKRKIDYHMVQEFDTLEEARQAVEDEWAQGRSEVMFNGTKYLYWCKANRKCPRGMYIMLPKVGVKGNSENPKVTQWETNDEHANHDEISPEVDELQALEQNVIDGSEGQVRYMKSARGSTKALLNGFVFLKNNTSSTATYWVCDQHRKGCTVRLTMYPDKPYKVNGSHTGHQPDHGRIRAMEVVEASKRMMLENDGLPTTQIMNHVESLVLEDPVCAPYMGTPSSFKRKILRARQRAKQKEGKLEVKVEESSEGAESGGQEAPKMPENNDFAPQPHEHYHLPHQQPGPPYYGNQYIQM